MNLMPSTSLVRHAPWFAVVASLVLVASVTAQPPGDAEGPPRDPLRAALDTNHDRSLDADEIKNASTALLTLDANGDGRIADDEWRPPMPPREGRGGPGGPGEAGRPRGGPGMGPGQGGGPGGPPSPERFVERALSFDGDSDGKLDRSELEKFAAGMMERMRGGPGGGPGRGGPGGPGRPEGVDRPERSERGDRPERSESGDRPQRPEGGDRPERPRRPE
jgi:hypothetical protein